VNTHGDRPAPRGDLHSRAAEAAASIRARVALIPEITVILGSGLNELADRITHATTIPYEQIPHFPRTSVSGHEGRLLLGELAGTPVIVFQGRFHYYEGHDLETVTFPVRVLQQLGVNRLILTAATGGIRAELGPGNLVLVTDHLNLAGVNPLRGESDPRLGLRFPDMTEVYSRRLRAIASEESNRLGIELAMGVYAWMSGPSYETPAEIKMLRTLGADVVGMSTVPEAIVARHAGIEVLAICLVSNAAAGVIGTPISHEEVLEAGRRAAPTLARLIERIIARMPTSCSMAANQPTSRP
jgi:purine-nucleoside phosphorylase